MFNVEFQAVVLAAGKGSRMHEITAAKPKCLLPVGNKPLVWYPLVKLQEIGFKDVILIVYDNQKSEIQSTLDKLNLSIKIDYVSIKNEDQGTADSLRLIHDKIKTDVLVLSCDLISDVNLGGVLNLFRMHNASLCALLFNPSVSEQVSVPGPKMKYKPERDLIGIDSQTNRLVFLASASDFETSMTLPKALIKKHTQITMYSNLIDSHVYVLKKWIIKYLQNEPSISTIKGELLPHIIRKQLLKPKEKLDYNTSIVNTRDESGIFGYVSESPLDLLIRETSSFNDHYGDLKSSYHGDVVRCFAYIAEPSVFGIRVNTLPAYHSVNFKIIDKWEKLTKDKELNRIDSSADIQSTQVDDKCIVWNSCKLSEKTSFKSSILGFNCEVEKFSRVFNSIIMNDVVIKEKVALENCIVCNNTVIESGCQIKNCLIGSQHVVPKDAVHTNELLTLNDRLMELE
ncbi:hypothetical protein RI129_005606 [Pyrocoelia pectoralis]|uniref:Translation initiation factor eIF2B subunit gamma n=1 Tax=Pyrocoelia pectoralis TaxID=417401 RepID=A0AAN7VEW5_9COLE